MAMTLVSTVIVGSGGAASIEFTNIPQTGKDLLLLVSLRNSVNFLTSVDGYLNFNSDTGANYTAKRLFGTGSSTGSSDLTADQQAIRIVAVGDTATSNTFSNGGIYVSNYTSSAAKSVSADNVTENNATESAIAIVAGRWSGTAAITSLLLGTGFGWKQHSTASLYIIS